MVIEKLFCQRVVATVVVSLSRRVLGIELKAQVLPRLMLRGVLVSLFASRVSQELRKRIQLVYEESIIVRTGCLSALLEL